MSHDEMERQHQRASEAVNAEFSPSTLSESDKDCIIVAGMQRGHDQGSNPFTFVRAPKSPSPIERGVGRVVNGQGQGYGNGHIKRTLRLTA
jgi:hypothetical protein